MQFFLEETQFKVTEKTFINGIKYHIGLFNGYNYDMNTVQIASPGIMTPQLKQQASSHNSNNAYAYTTFSNQTTRSISASSPLDQR